MSNKTPYVVQRRTLYYIAAQKQTAVTAYSNSYCCLLLFCSIVAVAAPPVAFTDRHTHTRNDKTRHMLHCRVDL